MGWGEDHCLGVGLFLFTILGFFSSHFKYNKYDLALIVNKVFIEIL